MQALWPLEKLFEMTKSLDGNGESEEKDIRKLWEQKEKGKWLTGELN